MAGSDITITALTATPTLRGTKLGATVNDPRGGAIASLAADAVEFYAAAVNNFVSAAKVVEGPGVASGNSEAFHAGLVEEQIYYYWAIARNRNGSRGAKFPASNTGGIAARAIGMSGLAFGIANGQLVVDDHSSDPAVASGALRIAIRTAAGNVPSDADPAFVAFRGAALNSGAYQIRTIRVDVSITIPNGATLNRTNGPSAARIWIPFIDDAGTLRLGVINTASTFFVNSVALPESGLISATAIDVSANSVTLYSTANVTNKPYRLLGYIEWNAAPTVGQEGVWAVPDTIELMAPHVLPPGGIVQQVRKGFVPVDDVTGIPYDQTLPQSNEGTFIVQSSITPRSPNNLITVEVDFCATSASVAHFIASLFLNSETNARAAAVEYVSAANKIAEMRLCHEMAAGGLSQMTFTMRGGLESGAGGAHWYVNTTPGSTFFFGNPIVVPRITIQEIQR